MNAIANGQTFMIAERFDKVLELIRSIPRVVVCERDLPD